MLPGICGFIRHMLPSFFSSPLSCGELLRFSSVVLFFFFKQWGNKTEINKFQFNYYNGQWVDWKKLPKRLKRKPYQYQVEAFFSNYKWYPSFPLRPSTCSLSHQNTGPGCGGLSMNATIDSHVSMLGH